MALIYCQIALVVFIVFAVLGLFSSLDARFGSHTLEESRFLAGVAYGMWLIAIFAFAWPVTFAVSAYVWVRATLELGGVILP